MTDDKPTDSAIALTCTTKTDGGDVILTMEAVNRSDRAVHVLASDRLPYLIPGPGEGELTALYGVNEPDPDIDYYGIEIPLTRPLAPGKRFTASARLIPLVPRHHYERSVAPVPVTGTLAVTCRLAYGDTPIDEARRLEMAINALIAWQQWVTAPVLRVDVPG